MSYIWATDVTDPRRVFHKSFIDDPAHRVQIIENLVEWVYENIPADEAKDYELQVVACRPHLFERLISGHGWLNKEHCVCFATYIQVFTGKNICKIRKTYMPFFKENHDMVQRMQRNAQMFQVLLHGSANIRAIIASAPEIRLT
ncbi:MAG: hypothetical protein FGM57_00905 [Candidatus Taylorbacteria bacterium]|nr:hypothetical protein [Candidatus Taylorbacteria bacterium]